MRGAGTGRHGGYWRGDEVVVHCCFNSMFIEIIYMWGLMCVEGFLSVGFEYMCRTGKQGRDRPETR